MTLRRKNQIRALLKGIETGDPDSVLVVNPDKYIQHNPQTSEGGEGLAALFKRLSQRSPCVNVVRAFSDGDYVFAHTEYDFGSARVGFEVFRFEGDQTVEHWDNIQPLEGPSRSGHTMVDGPTEATNLDETEANRRIVRSFVNEVLINRQIDKLALYLDDQQYTEHNPHLGDGVLTLQTALSARDSEGEIALCYERIHRVLAEGNFVLCVNEGYRSGVHASFYDLFRLNLGKLVEHWNTTEEIPPRSKWKNENGKF
jgi:predicted SnoaL-like aldol condensation-catalyzing enzyme